MEPGSVLWTPSSARAERSMLCRFLRHVETRGNVGPPTVGPPTVGPPTYERLHRWSIAEPERFWTEVADFTGLIADRPAGPVLENRDRMPGARWFPGVRLNFAENLLRRRDEAEAIIFRGEAQPRESLTFAGLAGKVARLSRALAALGVGEGDRVAGFLPNVPETVVAMLATTALGAVWSSCSPDFGVAGALDRFAQIEPTVLFTADGYVYAGKRHDSLGKAREIASSLASLRAVVVAPRLAAEPDTGGLGEAHLLDDLLAAYPAEELVFRRVAFDAPLYILFSSGTTGPPKCIVHGVGGTLLQHLKEHRLQCDVHAGDRIFYFTTCGWMMWNWLVSALASEATVLLYDGSPFHPEPDVLFDAAATERVTHFGVSAKYLDHARKLGLEPRRTHDLAELRTILSTGSPLAPEGFDYVYGSIEEDVCLSSISGGTDIISCFVGGNPLGPVRRGEIQAPGLGMAVDVFDEDGRSLRGEPGELVCTAPFPSMPIGFWNDPDGSRYRAAYFERFPGVWCHGDWAEITPAGGFVIHGRSDATLNPGGVRIGTAEIYRQVEHFDEVLEALVIGQAWEGDTRVVLFVRLRDGLELDDDLAGRLRRRIRENASPRHVPARILQVADIPRTRSGKIVELAVRDAVHGRPIRNREALANPEALDLFRELAGLKT